jgi:hypothetical protein
MRILRRSVFALLSGVCLLPFLSVAPALADDAIVNVGPTTVTELTGGEGHVLATLHIGTVPAGVSHNLRSEIVVGDGRADGAPSRVAVGHKITCQPVGGATLRNGQVWNGQNILANAADSRLSARMMFTPVVTGDYECLLRVYLNDGLAVGYESASLRHGFLADVDGAIGPASVSQVFGAATTFFALGSAGRQLQPVTGYQPAAGARSFFAVGDMYITSCYGTGGNACPADTYPTAGSALVRHRLVATPSILGGSCVAQATPSRYLSVSRYVHHQRISQEMTVSVPVGGCGTWTVNTYVQSAGGELPFVIHGNPYSLTYVRPLVG